MNPRSVQSDVTAQYSTEGGQFCFIIFGYTMNNAHIEMTQIKKKIIKNWTELVFIRIDVALRLTDWWFMLFF